MNRQSWFYKHRYKLIFGSVLFIAILAFVLRPPKRVKIDALQVRLGVIEQVLFSTVAGEVSPEKRVLVRAEVSGRVRYTKIAKGSIAKSVEAGELLVQFDPEELNARLKQANAVGNTARSQTEVQRELLNKAEKDFKRVKELFGKGAISQLEFDTAASTLSNAQKNILVSESRLDEASASSRLAIIAKRNSQVLAPSKGIVTDVYVSDGEFVAIGTPLFEFIDVNEFRIIAPFNEADELVSVGQVAEIKIEGSNNKIYHAFVKEVEPVIRKDLKGERTYRVELQLDSKSALEWRQIKMGSSVNVSVIVNKKENVLLLPNGTIYGKGRERTVYRLEKQQDHDYKLRKVSVSTGIEGVENTEIVQGVSVGDLILSSDYVRKNKNFEPKEGLLVEYSSDKASK